MREGNSTATSSVSIANRPGTGGRSFASVLLGLLDLSALPEPVTEGGITWVVADVENGVELDDLKEGEVLDVAKDPSVDCNVENSQTNVNFKDPVVEVSTVDGNLLVAHQDVAVGVEGFEGDVNGVLSRMDYDGVPIITSSLGRVQFIFDDIAVVEDNLSEGGEFIQVGKNYLDDNQERGKKGDDPSASVTRKSRLETSVKIVRNECSFLED
ncbi:hypothetical protein NE237_011323 [Protea cynaroides]|uniref:Uncharacterized protein n=1 Tax=Protea cynaroides TaxID=273540 RepID=A0A9Q0GVX0_9MAGN|nr:hypothetical protein NE237_011323 [Protea cynaroides]